MLNEWLNGGPTQASHESFTGQEYAIGDDRTMPQAKSLNLPKSELIQNNHIGNNCHYTTSITDVSSPTGNGQAGLHDAVHKGHIEKVKIILEGGANVHKLDAQGFIPKDIAENHGNKSTCNILDRYEHRKIRREQRIGSNKPVVSTSTSDENKARSHGAAEYFEYNPRKASSFSQSDHHGFCTNQESTKKRVTIHMQVPAGKTQTRHLAKLIILPDSIEELLRVAGKLYLICYDCYSVIVTFLFILKFATCPYSEN